MAASETTLMAYLAASFVLGLTHALEIDHMSAVSAFVATRPRAREAAGFGAKWALGHGLSLLFLGSILFALKMAISSELEQYFEMAVGVALVGLGLWTLFRLHAHRGLAHRHYHSATAPVWMGILHGIAGTAAFAGQAMAVASQSYLVVMLYTLSFSVGVLASMALFAGVLGAVIKRFGLWVQTGLAVWTCAVGLVWITGGW